MHERGSTLENYGICNLNIPGIAIGDDACRPRYRGRRAHEGAQRQRDLLAYCIKLPEPHGVLVWLMLSGATTNTAFPVAVGGHWARERLHNDGEGGTVERMTIEGW